MRKDRCEPARPCDGRDYELVRAGREGTYWMTAEGMWVRLAAAEREHDAASERAALRIVPFASAFGGVSER